MNFFFVICDGKKTLAEVHEAVGFTEFSPGSFRPDESIHLEVTADSEALWDVHDLRQLLQYTNSLY